MEMVERPAGVLLHAMARQAIGRTSVAEADARGASAAAPAFPNGTPAASPAGQSAMGAAATGLHSGIDTHFGRVGRVGADDGAQAPPRLVREMSQLRSLCEVDHVLISRAQNNLSSFKEQMDTLAAEVRRADVNQKLALSDAAADVRAEMESLRTELLGTVHVALGLPHGRNSASEAELTLDEDGSEGDEEGSGGEGDIDRSHGDDGHDDGVDSGEHDGDSGCAESGSESEAGEAVSDGGLTGAGCGAARGEGVCAGLGWHGAAADPRGSTPPSPQHGHRARRLPTSACAADRQDATGRTTPPTTAAAQSSDSAQIEELCMLRARIDRLLTLQRRAQRKSREATPQHTPPATPPPPNRRYGGASPQTERSNGRVRARLEARLHGTPPSLELCGAPDAMAPSPQRSGDPPASPEGSPTHTGAHAAHAASGSLAAEPVAARGAAAPSALRRGCYGACVVLLVALSLTEVYALSTHQSGVARAPYARPWGDVERSPMRGVGSAAAVSRARAAPPVAAAPFAPTVASAAAPRPQERRSPVRVRVGLSTWLTLRDVWRISVRRAYAFVLSAHAAHGLSGC